MKSNIKPFGSGSIDDWLHSPASAYEGSYPGWATKPGALILGRVLAASEGSAINGINDELTLVRPASRDTVPDFRLQAVYRGKSNSAAWRSDASTLAAAVATFIELPVAFAVAGLLGRRCTT